MAGPNDPRNPQRPARPPAGLPGQAGPPPQPVDPASLPQGHPLRALAAKLGVATEGVDAPPVAPTAPAPGRPAQRPGPRGSAAQLIQRERPADPLGRPYVLPSGGLLYGDHTGEVVISPMRGEQEEIIAGAGEGLTATPVLRHIVNQCVDTRGIPYDTLALSDWSALLLHVLALSLGEDNIPLLPACAVCGMQFDASRSLAKIPCRVLKRGQPGEPTTWPPETMQDEDEDLRILREMGLSGESAEQLAQQVYVVGAGAIEPNDVTLANGQTIGLRYLRVEDLVQAEDFAERAQSAAATTPGSRLHSFIHARSIATIDGRRVGALEAMRWVKQAPMPLLNELRAAGERRAFGYEFSPSFKCPKGHSFRMELPLNAAMFRRRIGSSVR